MNIKNNNIYDICEHVYFTYIIFLNCTGLKTCFLFYFFIKKKKNFLNFFVINSPRFSAGRRKEKYKISLK
jgi:hypothetical protein